MFFSEKKHVIVTIWGPQRFQEDIGWLRRSQPPPAKETELWSSAIHRDLQEIWLGYGDIVRVYPLVNCYIAMENIVLSSC